MSNLLTKIGHGLKVAGEDTVKVLEDSVTIGEKILKVFSTYESLSPAFKTELSQIVADASAIAASVAPAALAGGTNVASDLAAIAPATEGVLKLVKDIVAFLPTLEAALAALGTDVKA